jgi:undecaprenyl diphosphate synthase
MQGLKHVGIIMDGNGRWAVQRELPRKAGHKAGARVCTDIIHEAIDQNIEVLSLYAFSTENWTRPGDEVTSIISLLDLYLQTEILAFLKRGVKFVLLGDRTKLSAKTRFLLKNAERLSGANKGLKLQLAVNYGGKDEIIRSIKAMAGEGYDFNQINEQDLETKLDGGETPPIDLVIRTSGEKRLSNFMIWQCAYAEFYFTDTLWPDFMPADFNKAIDCYADRNRRFGDTGILMGESDSG